jgi:hypothetical protein
MQFNPPQCFKIHLFTRCIPLSTPGYQVHF